MKKFVPLCVLFCALFLTVSSQTVSFSSQRGFYTASFSLSLTTDLAGGTIYYTTNGTPPSSTIGDIYSAPISISTTSVVRAIAVSGATVTKIFTHTYIFPAQVVLQPASIPGWPNNRYELGNGSVTAVHDYEMDPDVVTNSAYSTDIITGLKAIPTISIVMEKDSFWKANDDVTETIKLPASIEFIYPNNTYPSEQFDGKFEPHSHLRLKRSFKISFPDPGITTKLFKNAPLNTGAASDHVDDRKIVLRGGNNDSWARNWNPSGTTYTRDEWYRASELAVSGYGSRGTFAHLYINGIYWGLYNPVERPDEGWTAEYLGGNQADWFSLNHDGIRSGDPTRYNYLMNTILSKDLSITTNYDEFKQYLSVGDFSDYIIISWMPGMADWPNNNYYGGSRNNPIEPFKFFGWDCEWSWTVKGNANTGAWVNPSFESTDNGGPPIASIWNVAKKNPDFLMAFADRVYKHCFNGGAMTDSLSRARWAAINNYVSTAIIAESARWGDSESPSNPPRTKNDDFTPEVNRVDGYMNGNVTRFIAALKAQGYYPTINPPNFNREASQVVNNFQLTMTNPNATGTIYYTINGADPLLPGGTLSPDALVYSSAITINSIINIKARVQNGNNWSALHEGTYGVYNLRINEFLTSNINGITDESGDHEDWIEIYNGSPLAVNIGGLYLTDAFTSLNKWQFPLSNPEITTIPPYGFKLIWADGETSEGKLHANFTLNNSGEHIAIIAKNSGANLILDSLSFGAQADDVSRGRFPDGSTDFQDFAEPTPGESNQLPLQGKLFINEFLASNQMSVVDEAGQHDDWIEIYNDADVPVNIGGLYVTDNLATLTMWQIPTTAPATTTIPGKGFLLLWADSEPAQGPLHVNFKLGNSGEQIGLSQVKGNTTIIIDSLTFGVQTANISRGRIFDGGNSFIFFPVPTPRLSNEEPFVDCNGDSSGTANIDGCGICAGGNTGKVPNANKDCNGVCNGTAFLDDCGVCVGGNTGKTANANKDACGVCFGDGSSCATCVQNQVVSFTLMREGTAGEIGQLTSGMTINKATIGKFSIRANVCTTPVGSVKFVLNGSTFRTETSFPYALNGDNSGSYIAWTPSNGSYTLKATPYIGASATGTSGVSLTVTFTVINQTTTVDCNGVTGGTAAIDGCGICAGGNTGKVPNANKDCNGVCNGTATLDDCGVCAGGNTGKTPGTARDCNGVCNGTAAIDVCGICAGGNTGKIPNANTDCNAVCNGTAYRDDCGVCVGGNTGKVANATKDCNGVCNGNAAIDGCGICAGGNTGKTPNANKDACGVCFGNGSTCPPVTCVHNQVISFTLMREGTAGEISQLISGMTINKATIGKFSVRANVCDSPVGSVKFILNGSTFRTETSFPYAINGDNSGSYIAWTPSNGSYTLKVTPYSGANATGTSGVSLTVTFTVVNQANAVDCNGVTGGSAAIDACGVCAGGNTGKVPNANKDCNGVCFGTAALDDCGICAGGNTGKTPNANKDACGVCNGNGSSCGGSSCVHLQVVSLTLMHEGTAGEIGKLTNGMVINKSAIGKFSIRADVCDSPVGSVKFTLNGSTFRTETSYPYALNGDNPVGSYIAWTPSAGSYTLKAKPYSGSSATGTAGDSYTVTFTVVNSSAKMEEGSVTADQSFDFNIYPNPNSGSFVVEGYNESAANVTVRVYNSLGQIIFNSTEKQISGNYTKYISLENSAAGIYFVEMICGEEIGRSKMLVE